MPKTMLIDATHPEETRVVVSQDKQLVDFDFETSTKKQLKGNIYLAKVTRVEASLQAAFVDYGGSRHGFLAFSEIHSDYYQIPQADRELLEEKESEPAAPPDPTEEGGDGEAEREDAPPEDTLPPEETLPSEDTLEDAAEDVDEQARRRARLLRSYKIQEVIKRRQILLVQVVKEERGNKGAALTTYLSLPGRYCVLMPNTPRGGGISRKISNLIDRKRLKSVVQGLDVPAGIGLIVRTAGQQRNKAEIKRDYEFLLRQWNEIRDQTLNSIAPAMIYEEGDLIKRAMRDLYSRDIDEVLVEGDEGYKQARRLMQMMMPSRARRVKQYKEELPLFFSFGIEEQLDDIYSPTVQLPSGGSIVIHSTEALTAIDVNSGRSTRERHIDETALKTNLEAADEIARQLRLRDLAGLIVVDFIDMSEMRHQRQVERRLRDAVLTDRARLQLGKISMFGLLELSRQRLRPSLQELSSQLCPTCSGLGVIRSTESCALHALRLVQGEGIKNEVASFQITLPSEVAFYLLNHKRDLLVGLEERYQMRVMVVADSEMLPPNLEVEVIEKRTDVEPVAESEEGKTSTPAPATTPETATAAEDDEDGAAKKRRRRRRRRRRGSEEGETSESSEAGETADDEAVATPAADEAKVEEKVTAAPAGEEQTDPDKRRRRRRRRRPSDQEGRSSSVAETSGSGEATPPAVATEVAAAIVAEIMAATGGSDDDNHGDSMQVADTPEIASIEAVTEPVEAMEESQSDEVTPAEPVVESAEPVEVEAAVDEPDERPADEAEDPAKDAISVEPPVAMAVEPEAVDEVGSEDRSAASDTASAPEPAMALAEGGAGEPPADDAPARQGWWSRWVR